MAKTKLLICCIIIISCWKHFYELCDVFLYTQTREKKIVHKIYPCDIYISILHKRWTITSLNVKNIIRRYVRVKSDHLKRDTAQCKKICSITHVNNCYCSRIVAESKKNSIIISRRRECGGVVHGRKSYLTFIWNTTDTVRRVRSSSKYCHFLFNLLSHTSYTSTPRSAQHPRHAASISQRPRTRGNAQPPRLFNTENGLKIYFLTKPKTFLKRRETNTIEEIFFGQSFQTFASRRRLQR